MTMKIHQDESMIHGFEFMDVEMLFQEVDILGIPYLIPVPELPTGREVHICRGTLRKALELEKLLQNRQDSASD